jgi:Spy/CpxP family protein refolding chaperone
MLPLAIGLGILGIVAMRRAHHRCHGYHGYGWQPRRYGRRNWMLHRMFERIDASPAQERAIVGEVDRLQDRVRQARHGIKDARGDLSAALRGPVLDDAALGAVLGRVDAATGEVRAAVIEALRNVHAVLDDKQRNELADLLDRRWSRGGGPYRM